jgi:hypothetical protein
MKKINVIVIDKVEMKKEKNIPYDSTANVFNDEKKRKKIHDNK